MGEARFLRCFYSKIQVEETWEQCATCGTRVRILDHENKECIRCQVQRARRRRESSEGGRK
jgi:uncharacterized paraquat-inducible protein A